MKRIVFIVLVVFAFFGSCKDTPTKPATPKPPVLVLEHANLIDGISDAPQRDVTVVVAEGKISVVLAARISPPANAERFDLSGRWLLPGFIAHQYSRLRLRPGPPTRFRVEGAALEDLDR